MSYDPKIYELAKEFLFDSDEFIKLSKEKQDSLADKLSINIQREIEDFIEFTLDVHIAI